MCYGASIPASRKPPRTPWRSFPDALLLTAEAATKRHPHYVAAKRGSVAEADSLVAALVTGERVAAVRSLIQTMGNDRAILVAAHAFEHEGFNAIPATLAVFLARRLGLEWDTHVVQTNVVCHTGADGYGRLARQAAFGGNVAQGRLHVMVDDFVGQGGTLANLRGWIETQGGKVIGAIGLAGKPYSAKLNPSEEQLHELRQRHGPELETWWRDRFGHAFDCLTQSEARYLARSPDVDTIRDRLTSAVRQGGDGARR